MRIIHVVPSIAEEASGPSYTVPRLCQALIASGADVRLAALGGDSPARSGLVELFPSGLGPRRLGVSPKMRSWLDEEVRSRRVDLIHNHSLWMMPNVYSGWACRGGRARLM